MHLTVAWLHVVCRLTNNVHLSYGSVLLHTQSQRALGVGCHYQRGSQGGHLGGPMLQAREFCPGRSRHIGSTIPCAETRRCGRVHLRGRNVSAVRFVCKGCAACCRFTTMAPALACSQTGVVSGWSCPHTWFDCGQTGTATAWKALCLGGKHTATALTSDCLLGVDKICGDESRQRCLLRIAGTILRTLCWER